jgi:hypothetical protein
MSRLVLTLYGHCSARRALTANHPHGGGECPWCGQRLAAIFDRGCVKTSLAILREKKIALDAVRCPGETRGKFVLRRMGQGLAPSLGSSAFSQSLHPQPTFGSSAPWQNAERPASGAICASGADPLLHRSGRHTMGSLGFCHVPKDLGHEIPTDHPACRRRDDQRQRR